MTLTDKWKKGELPYEYYYIKTISGGEVIDRYYRDCTDYDLCEYGDVWENRFEDEIEEVLAPVPSYEEWKRIFHCASKYEYEYTSCAMDYENLKQENQQLKELLKGCREEIDKAKNILTEDTNIDNTVVAHATLRKILTKIDNAIGEK